MARYSELPVFKDMYALTLLLFEYTHPSSKVVPSQALCSSEGCLAPLLKKKINIYQPFTPDIIASTAIQIVLRLCNIACTNRVFVDVI